MIVSDHGMTAGGANSGVDYVCITHKSYFTHQFTKLIPQLQT